MPDPIVAMTHTRRDLSLLRMACRLARKHVTDERTLSRLYRLQQKFHRELQEAGVINGNHPRD